MTTLTAVRAATRSAISRLQAASVPPIHGMICDLDGTLYDSEPFYRRAFHDALAELGFAADAALYAQLIGLATPDRLVRLARHFGTAFPAAAFKRRYYFHKQQYLASGVPLKPGAVALLEWLDAHGIATAIATTCSETTARCLLARAGLEDRFCTVVTRDHVIHRKPHPEPFLRAAQALGVAAGACLVLEDSAHGIEAAHAAGALPILIPDLAPVPAHVRRKSLAVLPDLHAVRAALAGF